MSYLTFLRNKYGWMDGWMEDIKFRRNVRLSHRQIATFWRIMTFLIIAPCILFYFEILRHQQPLWVSTQTGIKRRSKILELELLQEQSILTIKQ